MNLWQHNHIFKPVRLIIHSPSLRNIAFERALFIGDLCIGMKNAIWFFRSKKLAIFQRWLAILVVYGVLANWPHSEKGCIAYCQGRITSLIIIMSTDLIRKIFALFHYKVNHCYAYVMTDEMFENRNIIKSQSTLNEWVGRRKRKGKKNKNKNYAIQNDVMQSILTNEQNISKIRHFDEKVVILPKSKTFGTVSFHV